MSRDARFNPRPRVPYQGPSRPFAQEKGFINNTRDDSIIFRDLQVGILDGDADKIIQTLSQKSGVFSVRDSDDNTLLHIVLQQENSKLLPKDKLRIVSFLIDHGVPLESYNKTNITPLHLACKNQNKEIVDLLLEKGANPNAIDNYSQNTVHYAVKSIQDTCEKIIKPKSLLKKKNEQIKQDILKDISDEIIKSLIQNNTTSKLYVEHLQNILPTLDILYNDIFEQAEKDILNNITSIFVKSNSSNDAIQQMIKNIYDKVRQSIISDLASTFTPLKIELDVKNGINPITNPAIDILDQKFGSTKNIMPNTDNFISDEEKKMT